MSTIVTIEVIMVGAGVLGFVALALIAKALQTRGVIRDQAAMQRVTFAPLMGLFVLFAFGLIGLGLHLFIAGQGGIGNGGVGMVAFLRDHETGVALGFWAFLFVGFAIAYPFMRRDMLSAPPAPGTSDLNHEPEDGRPTG